jgi:heme/copper-type cytochrome/quinol oxidase subunit 1
MVFFMIMPAIFGAFGNFFITNSVRSTWCCFS